VPLTGDLAQPSLGLSSRDFTQLCQTIDVIYHNGAVVNLVYGYASLKAPNVLGTQEILKIASTSKIKPIHYVSTIGMFMASNGQDQLCYETDPIDGINVVEGGYAQSKWVAEKLLNQAAEKGLAVTIYRPGVITGHSITGVCSPHDWLSLILKSCLQTETLPLVDAEIAFTPVDYVSRGIVSLSQQSYTNKKAYHLVNPQYLTWNQVTDLITSLGYQFQSMSFEQWSDLVNNIQDNSITDSLQKLLPSLKTHSAQSGNVRFDAQNAIQELAKHEVICPSSILELLKSQLSYLQKCHF